LYFNCRFEIRAKKALECKKCNDSSPEKEALFTVSEKIVLIKKKLKKLTGLKNKDQLDFRYFKRGHIKSNFDFILE
jgi:hypothetical protein